MAKGTDPELAALAQRVPTLEIELADNIELVKRAGAHGEGGALGGGGGGAGLCAIMPPFRECALMERLESHL